VTKCVVARLVERLDTAGWPSQLHEYALCPDRGVSNMRDVLRGARPVACPRCNSVDTETLSEFRLHAVQGAASLPRAASNRSNTSSTFDMAGLSVSSIK